MTDEMTLLRRANPVLQPVESLELDERARRDLSAILGHRHTRSVPRARWVWATAAAAAAAVVVSVLGLPGAPQTISAYAATPPLLATQPLTVTAEAELNKLATLAGQQHTGPAVDGVQVIRTQSWALSTRVDGQTVASAVVPLETSVRWGQDGSGSLRAVAGRTVFPDTASEQAWRRAGEPWAPGTVVRDETYPPGRHATMWPGAPPTTSQGMATYLAIGHPISQIGTAELFVAVSDLALDRQLTGPQEAAVLDTLAKAPQVGVLGAVRDRLGRAGVAIYTDSDYSGLMTRYVLVFDPATGMLNASEEWLTTTAGALKVRVPAVISYSAWRH
jgi:hypothetical protein